jgi:hypothetical protein
MPYSSAVSAGGSSGEFISHFTGVRMRIVGDGEFEMTFISMDDTESQVLVPFTLEETTDRQPFRLANFKKQRALLEGKTDLINEFFKIDRIIIFAKELWTEYPSVG